MYGVLFDGAWLWEEYLDLTMHKVGFKHPKNKERQGPIHLFKEKKPLVTNILIGIMFNQNNKTIIKS